jgi:ATP-dependent Lon protease
MKVLAAHRAGLSTVILPKRNERDLDDVPDEIRKSMQFILVDRIDEAIDVGLTSLGHIAGARSGNTDSNLNPITANLLAM